MVWQIEDWWASFLGIGVVVAAFIIFLQGHDLTWLVVQPRPWASLTELRGQLAQDFPLYTAQYLVMLVVFMLAGAAMGLPMIAFAGAFTVLYALTAAVLIASASSLARRYHIDTPLIALGLGLLLSNAFRLPPRLQVAFRVEFYIKIGIVLLGASLPLTLILWAGPIAILQASIVSMVTFLVIYRTGRFLELDRRLAAMLAAGGAVCGVSAIAAVAGAIRARREDITVAIGIVVLWAIFLIVGLPLLARAWFLPAGVAGAWIGSSQFADAAGFAAVQTYGAMLRAGSTPGTPDQALQAYTLVKVVGRDLWIGIWAFALSIIAMTRWGDARTSGEPAASDIWTRFPKFIIGFIVCALLVSMAAHGETFHQFNETLRPALIAPIETLRGWAFTFSFLSIGLTCRVRGFAPVTGNAFIAFSTGVLVNLVLGFILSAVVFRAHWANLAP